MIRRNALLACAFLAATALPACTASTEDDDVVTPGDDADGADELISARFTEKHNGQTVAVKVGQNIYVRLASNASTGYDWSVASVDKTLGQPRIYHSGGGGAVGSGGATIFKWTTKSPLNLVGKHPVKLIYSRSWEKDVPPAQTYEITFDIQQVVTPTSGAVQITHADNGKTFDVVAGNPVVLTLPQNASTGYLWSVESTDKTFGHPQMETQPGDPNIPGNGGTQTFTWRTTSVIPMVGKHTVRMILQRPFAETVPPAETFTFSVNIKEPGKSPAP